MRDNVNVELISCYVDDELMSDDQAVVERLLAESAAHRQLHDDLLALRAACASLPRYRLSEDFADRVVEAALRARASRNGSTSRIAIGGRVAGEAGSRLRRWHSAVFVAAAVAALLLVGLLPLQLHRGEAPVGDGVAGTANGKASANPSPGEFVAGVGAEGSDSAAGGQVADMRDIALAKATPGRPRPVEFLFVIDVTIGKQGRERTVFENALAAVGIPIQTTIEVEPELETSLLQSRFLGNVTPQRQAPDESGNVQLLYVTGTGEQIDVAVADLQSRPRDEVGGVRFDLAIEPSDLELFEQLQQAAQPEFAVSEPAGAPQSGASAAHWLALPFALFSTSTHSLLTYTPPTEELPRVEVQSIERPAGANGGAAVPRGAQRPPTIYRVLVVLRHAE